jgi:hypothetical protein
MEEGQDALAGRWPNARGNEVTGDGRGVNDSEVGNANEDISSGDDAEATAWTSKRTWFAVLWPLEQ